MSSVTSFFSTDRTSQKWIVNSNGTHTTIQGGVVPVDHHANGDIRGILVEDASQNLFPNSTSYSHSSLSFSSGASVVSASIGGSSNAVRIGSTSQDEYMTCSFNNLSMSYVAITLFVSGITSFSEMNILLNGSNLNFGGADVEEEGPFNGGFYRLRVRAFVPSQELSSVAIGKRFFHSGGFDVANVQIERDKWTSYIPTSNGPVSRPKETVFRNLTHRRDYNKDQGTFDVQYTPVPGSVGCAMSFRDSGWNEWVSVGVQKGELGYPEAVRFDSSTIEKSLAAFSQWDNITGKECLIRVCYSGYGVRVFNMKEDDVWHLKDFNAFLNGIPDRIVFGECYTGDHFTGHIELLNIYHRTFNEDEMKSS